MAMGEKASALACADWTRYRLLPVASSSRKRKPKPWKWRLEWLAQTGIEKVAALLPGPFAFRLGEVLGGLACIFMTTRRQIVLRNLRIAFHGEKDLPELRAMVRETFRRTGANLLSALHSTQLTAAEVSKIVTVENPEKVDDALTRGHGVVLMPSHMGNWEILTRIHRELPPGHRNGAFYRPLNNPLLDKRVLAQRESEGCRLFSKRDSFLQAAAFLREGGILGILADQRSGKHGELVRFFGRLTRASPLPSLLARRSKTQALAMSLATAAPGKWRTCYHPLIGPISTASCIDAIERAIKTSPLDYFWLQERWKVYVHPDHTVRDWLENETSAPGKRHRALLWLPGTPTAWALPEAWTHPDVDYEVVPENARKTQDPRCLHLRFHASPAYPSLKNLSTHLAEIDAAAALPIDYILTCKASTELILAARRQSIPLVSLPPDS